MNYLSEGFNYDYISKRVNLTWKDIAYGIGKNYIPAYVAVEHAMCEVSLEKEYPQCLIDLASLNKNESIYPYLNQLVDSQSVQEEDETTREKWMYLILDWIYNNKDKYPNALELVEQVYSDFDYPERISTFVRYMPTNEPDLGSLELNQARLYKIWKDYLEEQSKRFLNIH